MRQPFLMGVLVAILAIAVIGVSLAVASRPATRKG